MILALILFAIGTYCLFLSNQDVGIVMYLAGFGVVALKLVIWAF